MAWINVAAENIATTSQAISKNFLLFLSFTVIVFFFFFNFHGTT